MPVSPENLDPRKLERKQQILLIAAGIALATAAHKKNWFGEKKIYHASFWPASGTVMADIIDEAKKITTHFSGVLNRSEEGEILGVEVKDETDPSDETMVEYEERFSERLEVERSNNSLQEE